MGFGFCLARVMLSCFIFFYFVTSLSMYFFFYFLSPLPLTLTLPPPLAFCIFFFSFTLVLASFCFPFAASLPLPLPLLRTRLYLYPPKLVEFSLRRLCLLLFFHFSLRFFLLRLCPARRPPGHVSGGFEGRSNAAALAAPRPQASCCSSKAPPEHDFRHE